MVARAMPWLLGLTVAGGPVFAGQLVCHFDACRDADVNDFGDRVAVGEAQLGAPGSGCPVAPAGRALDTGAVGELPRWLEFAISSEADFSQGTFECWVKPRWDWQTDRDHHSFLYLKLGGGQWESICLYHHGRMGDARTLAFNVFDGVDNCILVPVEQLGWRADEWHHIAASWTPFSQWLFADGRLVAKRIYPDPVRFGQPAGRLQIGPPGLWRSAAATLIDEVRVCDRPLYVGLESFPVPTAPFPHELPGAVAARVTASSTTPPIVVENDVPALHNGEYGDGLWIDAGGETWARIDLAAPTPVAGLRWSRDGRPLRDETGWAKADAIPKAFRVDVSPDGQTWRTVVEETDFWYVPDRIPRDGMIFEHRFEPTVAQAVRWVVTAAHAAPLGPRIMLDELQAVGLDGTPLPTARVVTSRTSTRLQFDPEQVLDGRLGEASCWRAAEPGEAWLELVFPAPRPVNGLRWSRSAEGAADGGTPRELAVEAEVGGAWREIGRVTGNASPGRQELALEPVTTVRLRVRVLATVDGKAAVIDELEVR